MNDMYEYLKDHAYISKNKKSNYQFELSKERAECIANKYDNLIKELQKENGALKEDIKFCLQSIKQEMELSKDSRTRSEMNDCYEILKGWVK